MRINTEKLDLLVTKIMDVTSKEDLEATYELFKLKGRYEEVDIKRLLLTHKPEDVLLEIIGSRQTLISIAERLEIDDPNLQKSSRNEICRFISYKVFEKDPYIDFCVSGFYIVQKITGYADSVSSRERYNIVAEAVNKFEHLLKSNFRMLMMIAINEIDPNIEDLVFTNNKNTKKFLQGEKFFPLGYIIDLMQKANEITTNNKIYYNECLNIFGRYEIFPNIDINLLKKFKNLRNSDFGHDNKPYIPPEHKENSAIEMASILSSLCNSFRLFNPKVIIQIQHIQDHYGRHRIYYLDEEEDFDWKGALRDDVYKEKFLDNNYWDIQKCSFYCLTSFFEANYIPGQPMYLFETGENKPYLDPRLHNARNLVQLHKDSQTLETEDDSDN